MNVIFGGYRFQLTGSYTTRWDSTVVSELHREIDAMNVVLGGVSRHE